MELLYLEKPGNSYNEGSRKVILANEGIYDATAFESERKVNLERYWIAL